MQLFCHVRGLQGTVFDYYVDEQNVCMAHWSQRVPQFTYIPGEGKWHAPAFLMRMAATCIQVSLLCCMPVPTTSLTPLPRR